MLKVELIECGTLTLVLARPFFDFEVVARFGSRCRQLWLLFCLNCTGATGVRRRRPATAPRAKTNLNIMRKRRATQFGRRTRSVSPRSRGIVRSREFAPFGSQIWKIAACSWKLMPWTTGDWCLASALIGFSASVSPIAAFSSNFPSRWHILKF